MDVNSIFSLANMLALIGWILLIVFPRKNSFLIIQNGIIIIFSVLYFFLFLSGIANFNLNSFSTLQNVKTLFQNDSILLAGWLHYLAFDLFVGVSIVKKAQELNISRWVYGIALPFTFMFGPVGYLIFYVIKSIKTRSLTN